MTAPIPSFRSPVDVDTLHLSCYGEFDYSVIESLDSFREKAKLIDGPYPCTGEFEGWSIMPYGNSKKGYTFILLRDDVRVYIGKGTGEAAPNMFIQIGSLSCHSCHLVSLREEIFGFFSFDCKRHFVSRGDICRDVACDFTPLYLQMVNWIYWYWYREVKWEIFNHGSTFCGMQFGRGKIVMRLYNKSYELIEDSKGKVIRTKKAQYYQDYYGLDLKNNPVWRLEYQLRREALRTQYGIETLEDFLENKDALWAKLSTERIIFSEEPVKRGTGHSKASDVALHSLWSLYLVDEKPIARQLPRRSVSRPDRLVRQGIGCLFSNSLAETESHDLSDVIDHMCDTFEFFVEQQVKKAGWVKCHRDFGGSDHYTRYERRLRNFRNMNHEHYHEVPF